MRKTPSKPHTFVLVGGWVAYVGYRALLSRFPDAREVAVVALIVLEAILFGGTVQDFEQYEQTSAAAQIGRNSGFQTDAARAVRADFESGQTWSL